MASFLAPEMILSITWAQWRRLFLINGVSVGVGEGGIVGSHATLSVGNVSSIYWSRGRMVFGAWSLELYCFISNPGSTT